MRLTSRPTADQDLSAAVGMLPDLVYGALRGALIQVWRDGLSRGGLITSVMEDEERPPGSRIIGFGITSVVTDQFFEEVKVSRRPGLGHILVDSFASGRSPILDRAGVRDANSTEGLSVILQGAIAQPELAEKEIGFVVDLAIRTFLEVHAGYNIKRGVNEAFSDAEMPMHYAVGGPDLRVEPIVDASPALPASAQPRRLWFERGMALTIPGSQLCRLFLYEPPRFSFRATEQELLQHALTGKTDEELSAALHVSLSAVKKRWQNIYDRVAAEDPALLPGVKGTVQEGKRGAEKKHRLVDYLRHHPEELRPHRRHG